MSLCFSWNILLIFLYNFFLKQDRNLNKTLQSRHAQFSRFHFCIDILKGSTYLVKFFQILDPMNERYFSTHDALSLMEVWWTGSYFSGWSVAHSFVQNVFLQWKEKGHSLFYIFYFSCRNLKVSSVNRNRAIFFQQPFKRWLFLRIYY